MSDINKLQPQKALYAEIGGEDYVLRDESQSVWITVGNVSVYIKRDDEGVSVDLYPLHNEMTDSLAGCWLTFADAEAECEAA